MNFILLFFKDSILAIEYILNPCASSFFLPGWNDFSINIPIPEIFALVFWINLIAPEIASPLAKKSSIIKILSLSLIKSLDTTKL